MRPRLGVRRPPAPALVSVAEFLGSMRAMTYWPLLFRSAMVVSAVAAAVLAAARTSSPMLVLASAVLMAMIALAAAVLPGSPAPLVVQLALVGEVVVTRGGDPSAWVTDGLILLGVTCLAYLHHASAAMAAALPWQASPRQGALAALTRRTAAVLGATVGVGVVVLLVAGGVHGQGPSVLALLGLVLAAAIGLLPALLLRRFP
jgi:hypothetical protein